MKTSFTLILSLILFNSVFAQNEIFKIDEVKNHINYLASDKLGGREPGTKGEKLAIKYIENHFKSYKLIPAGKKGYQQCFDYRTKTSVHDTVAKGKKKCGTNIIGFLDNGREKTLVIGGHFDHLGHNNHGSSLDKDRKQIHNGADDNASGTAGVLELARFYSENGIRENCNYLFMCFSGEEDGLIGSKFFTNNPTFDLSKITCMINMDMIGRLNDSTHKLMVYGIGTSPVYTHIFETLKTDLKFVYDSSGIGPSDQTSFYLKNIPVLHFFTGQHSDYHKSTDDANKINYSGEVEVLKVVMQVTDQLCNEKEIAFTKTRSNEQGKVSFKVTLGIMPDYTYEGEGVRADAVTEGKPAANGGIKGGDIILKLGDHSTLNMQAYMRALGQFKKGDQTKATVLRNKETLILDITF